MRAAGEGPRVLLLRMRCMKRAHVALYDGCSISGISRRNVNERIIGSSDCGRSGRAACLLLTTRSLCHHTTTLLYIGITDFHLVCAGISGVDICGNLSRQ